MTDREWHVTTLGALSFDMPDGELMRQPIPTGEVVAFASPPVQLTVSSGSAANLPSWLREVTRSQSGRALPAENARLGVFECERQEIAFSPQPATRAIDASGSVHLQPNPGRTAIAHALVLDSVGYLVEYRVDTHQRAEFTELETRFLGSFRRVS